MFFSRRFFPFFLTFFFGAFNDNLFRNALVIMISYQSGYSSGTANALSFTAMALLMLPYFPFSATAGQLADKFPRHKLFRACKIMEFVLMVPVFFAFLRGSVWPLLALLFFMGTQSALFSPLKYAYIPQMLEERELLRGNAYVNAGTYIAVIFGAVLGNYLITVPHGGFVTGAVILLMAALGLCGAFLIPDMPPESPALRIDPNIIRASWDVLRAVFRDKVLTHCVIGLSTFWMTAALYVSLLAGFCKDVLSATPHLVPILYMLFSAGVAIGSVACQTIGRRRAVMPLVSLALVVMAFFTLDLFFAARSWTHVPEDPRTLFTVGEITALTTLSEATLKAPGTLFTVGELLRFPVFWRIAADLVLLAACGGFYSVPLNALLQHKADPQQVARAVAANNIVNSFAIALGTIVSAQLMAHGIISAVGVFVLVAAVNFLTALYLLPIRTERLPRK
ncbi:MAG: MFS transporter [Lentisphaeria bacterium]|nr:MFS transporter [Lentisphaeria bacterium]